MVVAQNPIVIVANNPIDAAAQTKAQIVGQSTTNAYLTARPELELFVGFEYSPLEVCGSEGGLRRNPINRWRNENTPTGDIVAFDELHHVYVQLQTVLLHRHRGVEVAIVVTLGSCHG